MVQELRPKGRAKWRTWLGKNHETKTEVWVVFYKKHTGKQTLTYNDAVEEALCYGWIDGIRKRIDDQRYKHIFTPRRDNSLWSPSNKKRVARPIKDRLITKAGQAKIDIAKKNGKWNQKPAAEVSFAMPTELKNRLAKNKTAAAFFEGLTPTQRKNFIAWIASAKKPEIRERRAQESVRLLAKKQKLG